MRRSATPTSKPAIPESMLSRVGSSSSMKPFSALPPTSHGSKPPDSSKPPPAPFSAGKKRLTSAILMNGVDLTTNIESFVHERTSVDPQTYISVLKSDVLIIQKKIDELVQMSGMKATHDAEELERMFLKYNHTEKPHDALAAKNALLELLTGKMVQLEQTILSMTEVSTGRAVLPRFGSSLSRLPSYFAVLERTIELHHVVIESKPPTASSHSEEVRNLRLKLECLAQEKSAMEKEVKRMHEASKHATSSKSEEIDSLKKQISDLTNQLAAEKSGSGVGGAERGGVKGGVESERSGVNSDKVVVVAALEGQIKKLTEENSGLLKQIELLKSQHSDDQKHLQAANSTLEKTTQNFENSQKTQKNLNSKIKSLQDSEIDLKKQMESMKTEMKKFEGWEPPRAPSVVLSQNTQVNIQDFPDYLIYLLETHKDRSYTHLSGLERSGVEMKSPKTPKSKTPTMTSDQECNTDPVEGVSMGFEKLNFSFGRPGSSGGGSGRGIGIGEFPAMRKSGGTLSEIIKAEDGGVPPNRVTPSQELRDISARLMKIDELEHELKLANAHLKKSESDYVKLLTQYGQLQAQHGKCENLTLENSKLSLKIAHLEQEKLKSPTARSGGESEKEMIRKLQNEVTTLQTENKKLRSELFFSVQTEISELKTNNQVLRAQVASLETEKLKMAGKMQGLESELKTVKMSSESGQRFGKLGEQVYYFMESHSILDLDELFRKIQELERELQLSREEFSQLHEEYQKVLEQMAELETINHAVHDNFESEMTRLEQQKRQLESQLHAQMNEDFIMKELKAQRDEMGRGASGAGESMTTVIKKPKPKR